MRSFETGNIEEEEKDPQAVWSFFDAYKISGSGKTVARPEIDTFQHVSEETKRRDRALLESKMRRPQLREQKAQGSDAFAFENFLTAEALNHHWFGGELSPTSIYDDWISGVDAVVEWPGDPPVRLAIDFTTAVQDKTFLRKSDKLEGNAQVKYFRSRLEIEQGVPKEMRVSMPIVLLGFDDSIFRKIAQDQEPMSGNHPLRRSLLEQALVQIRTQLEILIDKETTGSIHSGKNQHRKEDLRRTLAQLERELQFIGSEEPDVGWRRLIAASKTHRVLSGTS
jgi:hypothetical protein